MGYKDLFRKYKALLFCYIRTTGANPYTSQVCELAAVKFLVSNGKMVNGGQMDRLIRLNPGVMMAQKFEKYLGFTSQQLTKEGESELEVCNEFYHMLTDNEEKDDKGRIVTKNTLVIAHHGQITFEFINQLLVRYGYFGFMRNHDLLDTMTVLRDRRAGAGNLIDAFHEYGMEDKPEETKTEAGKIALKGMDEVKHLAYVTLKMDQERPDLYKYINVFGVKPNAKKPMDRFPHVVYREQTPCESIRAENDILPMKKIG